MSHQFTQKFIRNDGTEDKAIITCRPTKHGYTAAIKIGAIQRTVTSAFREEMDAFNCALRILVNHRENAILD